MGEELLHWESQGGAACGAPGVPRLTCNTHVVTCVQCRASLEAEAARRRESLRRLSITMARLRSRVAEPC